LEHDDPGFRTLTPRNLLATQVFPSVPGAREYGVIGWSVAVPAIGGRFHSKNLFFAVIPTRYRNPISIKRSKASLINDDNIRVFNDFL
jgi:hypothetical protein